MNVTVLLTIPEDRPEVSYLTLKTVRVGFPTAHITVNTNDPSVVPPNCDAYDKRTTVGSYLPHWERIKREVKTNGPEPLVILDGDLIFYESCESWDIPTTAPIAGALIPSHINEYTNDRSVTRVHTSFLWFPAPEHTLRLCESVDMGFAPFNGFAPFRVFRSPDNGLFYDTCANLYNVSPNPYHFSGVQRDAYTHVFCGGSMHHARRYLCPTSLQQLEHAHATALSDPKSLRGCWRAQDNYYRIERNRP